MRGSGLANSIGRLSGIVTPFCVAALLSASGVVPVFLMMSCVALSTAAVIARLGFDTRGMTAEEIGNVAVGGHARA